AERASVRYRAARRAAPLGGSNRLLSVEELAAYLGVPKKTVYGCWRQWGLRGYRVGRYLRVRERAGEPLAQCRGALAPWPEAFNAGRAPKPSGRVARTSGWSATAPLAAGPATSASSPSAMTGAKPRTSRSRSSTISAPACSSTPRPGGLCSALRLKPGWI